MVVLDAATWLDTGNASLFPPGRLTTPILCAFAGWCIWESQRTVAVVRAGEGETAALILVA
ncbi:MAG TPA: hypothetical protein VMO88_14345 [Acidimicrobiales bacterium]|nr:hypothetical protein [Acidimicrobiales bacterium]